jgi:hypothetical protein
MKRLVLAVLTASVLGLFGEQQVCAQAFGTQPFGTQPSQFGTYSPPYYYPPVSPYLNILRGGVGGAGINYFTLTQPQFQTANSLLQLQDQANLLGLQQQALLAQGGLYAPGVYGQGLPGAGLLGQGLVAPGLLNAALLSGGTGQSNGLGGLTTGHPVLFGSTGIYYNSQPVRGATVPR